MSDIEDQLARVEAERDEARAVLAKINDIRNSIIGFQKVGWSEHVYPLVAALGEAGFEGEGYEEARDKARTLLDQRDAAEDQLTAMKAERDGLREALEPFANEFGDGVPRNDDFKLYGNLRLGHFRKASEAFYLSLRGVGGGQEEQGAALVSDAAMGPLPHVAPTTEGL